MPEQSQRIRTGPRSAAVPTTGHARLAAVQRVSAATGERRERLKIEKNVTEREPAQRIAPCVEQRRARHQPWSGISQTRQEPSRPEPVRSSASAAGTHATASSSGVNTQTRQQNGYKLRCAVALCLSNCCRLAVMRPSRLFASMSYCVKFAFCSLPIWRVPIWLGQRN
jgi:hypothetical protein